MDNQERIQLEMLRPIYAVLEREVIRMMRQRTRLVASMVRPLIWLLVIGSGFGSVVEATDGFDYQNFLVPGIIGMTKSLAMEYAKKNITLNCVSPGFIQTNMTDKIEESMKSNLISRIPMSKLGTGEDVANTVAFLSSDNASYITGETIHVNGGMYMA